MDERQLELVNEFIPQLEIRTHRILNRGVDSVAVLANDEYVFRFPLRPSVPDEYLREKRVLDILQNHIKSVEIPKIEIYGEGEDIHLPSDGPGC
ncbi:MAG: hypothetical protein LBI29_01575 [Rickettsiales bacterium]|jgi:hypothetical protein|nr:hypothetical protein [Rickettsiales bacterium]